MWEAVRFLFLEAKLVAILWQKIQKRAKMWQNGGKILRNAPENVATQLYVNESHKEVTGNGLEETFYPAGITKKVEKPSCGLYFGQILCDNFAVQACLLKVLNSPTVPL